MICWVIWVSFEWFHCFLQVIWCQSGTVALLKFVYASPSKKPSNRSLKTWLEHDLVALIPASLSMSPPWPVVALQIQGFLSSIILNWEIQALCIIDLYGCWLIVWLNLFSHDLFNWYSPWTWFSCYSCQFVWKCDYCCQIAFVGPTNEQKTKNKKERRREKMS